jgi:arylsulfatase A-like enzyme
MSDIEQLLETYSRGGMSRRAFVAGLLALGISWDFIETLLGPGARRALAASPQKYPSRAPYVVMVVLDAFRSDYMDLAAMPNLEWLISRGVFYPNAWVGHLEGYTPASHATLSTGATPAHHGVIGFEWRDPKTGQEDKTGWYDGVMAGRLEEQLRQHRVDSIPAAMKRQDPHARVVATSVEKYYAADALGGPFADFIFYAQPSGKNIVARGIPHHAPPHSFLRRSGLKRSWPLRYGQFDEMAMTMALEALHVLDPRVLLINLPGHDIYGHRVGGPDAPEVMRRLVRAADAQLGRLIRALRHRGILDHTVIVVTGDHGMVGNTFQIDDGVLKAAIRQAGGQYLFHTGGSSAYIWLKNRQDAAIVAQKLVDLIPSLPLSGSTSTTSASFAHYQTVHQGVYRYHQVAQTGTTVPADLEAAYQYLLRTFAGPLAPDIALTFQEDMICTATPDRHGEHGGASWGSQRVPLVISGPGFRAGALSQFPARLMDVAPSVLTGLGLSPRGMDGVVMADALRHPSKHAVRAQDGIHGRLLAYQKALITRSQADLAGESGIDVSWRAPR